MGEAKLDLSTVIERHSPRLLQLIRWRMSAQIARRIDAEDVLQEALITVAKRWESYQAKPTISLYVWLRGIVLDRLIDAIRFHGAGMRNLSREQVRHDFESKSSLDFAENIKGDVETPSQHAMIRERDEAIARGVEQLSDRHRNIILMRFFEKLSIQEVAEAENISIANAKVIQFRAMKQFAKSVDPFLSQSDIRERP